MTDKTLERRKRMVPVSCQQFVDGSYVFDGHYGVWLMAENSFENFSGEEPEYTEHEGQSQFVRQCMVTTNYLACFLNALVNEREEFGHPLSASEKESVKSVVERIKLIESLDPYILIDLEN